LIKKISSIKNLAVFNDFEWDRSVLGTDGRPIQFEKMNILYGRNYSGKTTLSRILRAMETGEISDKYENPSFTVSFNDGTTVNQNQISTCNRKIRVFNEDFVRDNLRFISNPDDTIEPFAILGDDNNILEQKIAAIESEVGSNEEGKQTGLYALLKAKKIIFKEVNCACEQVASSLDSQLTEKATGRANGIKYKLDKFNEPNYNKIKLGSDIQNVLSNTYVCLNEDKKSEYEQLITERIKSTIPEPPTLSLRWEQFCSQSEELLSMKIGASDKIAELLRDVTLNEWVKKGCELHKDIRTTCAFCGSIVSDDRWAVLYKHFDDESRILEVKIDSLLKQIETEIKLINDGLMVDKELFYSKFQKQLEQLSQSYSAAAKNYVEQLKSIMEQLTKRKEAITVSRTFEAPMNYFQELYAIWKGYEGLCVQSNDFSSKLNKEQIKAREALRLQEVYEFCSTIRYSTIVKNIGDLKNKSAMAKEAVDRIEAEIKAKEAEIQDKKRQLNDEEKGAVLVNKYLTDFFGHEFLSLVAKEDTENGEKKIRFEIVRNGKRAYHLSEGECSLIAFCYFMAKLDDIETKDTKPIIWIDDPISSLDGNHIFFVYSLIAAEIAEKGSFEQLFISTHSLNFLKYLIRLKGIELLANGEHKKCGKKYFIINRQGCYSTILQMPNYLKEYGTEFNFLFSCVYKCSCITTVDDANYHLFYNFGNDARKFLEIYLYFKYPDSSSTDDKLKRFFGENKVPYILTNRINNEYSHLQGAIERAAMPIEVPEMVSTAKLIIEKVKEDSDQYVAFLNSIGVSA
jgi:wobble nucleotide-excising tRNase